MKYAFGTIGVTLAAITISGIAMAAPMTSAPKSDDILVTGVATYVCARDDRGWHYMRGDRRTTCRPARPSEGARFYGWRCEGPRCGWWHRNERRWHDDR